MTRPTPEPVDPSRLPELALAVIAKDRFPVLASIDGDQPRARPISPLANDRFTVYFASLKAYHKTGELEANPRVELCYMDPAHDQVRLTGSCERVTDRAKLQELWDSSPLLRQYLGSIDNPQLVIYAVKPSKVRFMREWALEYFDVPLA
jgi:general stress protein 26